MRKANGKGEGLTWTVEIRMDERAKMKSEMKKRRKSEMGKGRGGNEKAKGKRSGEMNNGEGEWYKKGVKSNLRIQ
jgi:hypothetical protein